MTAAVALCTDAPQGREKTSNMLHTPVTIVASAAMTGSSSEADTTKPRTCHIKQPAPLTPPGQTPVHVPAPRSPCCSDWRGCLSVGVIKSYRFPHLLQGATPLSAAAPRLRDPKVQEAALLSIGIDDFLHVGGRDAQRANPGVDREGGARHAVEQLAQSISRANGVFCRNGEGYVVAGGCWGEVQIVIGATRSFGAGSCRTTVPIGVMSRCARQRLMHNRGHAELDHLVYHVVRVHPCCGED
mmetsp:Transcript_89621/g.272049  ORF Transcript_89621/g.272049 Transcript_89621/m.272049 type:complete len:242 (-) Transcript_89621:1146-1871(-)